MRSVDLRSDTVTRPTPEMRRAMAEAEVGDDVWGDDPTVIELEAETARVLGKEAAVYVPSGTMGNQASVRAHTRRGDEILVHRLAHVVVHEQGGVSALSGVQPKLLDGDRGMLDVETLEAAWHDASDLHYARQSLISIENTVGEAGGLVVPPERIREIAGFARGRDMRLHMDGARLWNAAVALGVPPADLVAEVDSVSVCFSKGLGAPVGSAEALVGELAEAGVLAGWLDAHTVRFVTHLDAQEAAVDAALESMAPMLR